LYNTIVGCHKRGSGVSVENEAILFDKKTGLEYYKIRSGSFLVGAKDFLDSGITFSEKVKPPSREPDAVEELTTSKFQAQLYRLSGDYNPLHVSSEFANMVGFKEPILHGLCTLGVTARALVKCMCLNDPSRFQSIKVRFSKPVLPGDTLVVKMWNEGSGKVVFTTSVKETGAVVINNAVFQMKMGAKM